MATKINKNKTIHSTKRIKKADDVKIVTQSQAIEGQYESVFCTEIDFSPLNYRKLFSQQSLEDFASELVQHGIISPLTLRKMPSGRYELVAGERRLRAAKIAGLKQVPAIVKTLTDEQVIEIQLSENLQREDPHPMHEAQAIGLMQRTGKTIAQIAARLGKSKQFIYSRLKLLSLIDSFQEMVLADGLTISQAFEIASVSAESQAEFFEAHCSGWRDKKSFSIYNLSYYLNQFKYDLKEAPFNIKDKQLLPDVGACTGCPANTATLKTLFPEYAKHAVCTNRECYHKKCTAHFLAGFTSVFEEQQPSAILFDPDTSPMVENILSLVPGVPGLPRYNPDEITMLFPPEIPDKEDYTDDWNDDDPEFDEEGFKQAIDEYHSDLEAYNLQLETGKYQKAILIENEEFKVLLFSPEPPRHTRNHAGNIITAKEVQAAIKAGTATPELLEAEIQRINTKEKRSLELDREKIQLMVHDQFQKLVTNLNTNTPTDADLTGARLVIYQSLDYSSRQVVDKVLFPDFENIEIEHFEHRYHVLSTLTEQQYSYLIRMAVAGKSESKYPGQDAGFCLYKMAEQAGLDVQEIEQRQQQTAEVRQGKQNEKIKELEKKLMKMKPEN